MASKFIYTFLCSAIFLIFLNNNAASVSIVKNLPGFNGDLPFKLETGYISVGNNDELQFFYYFFESERDTVNDPLVLALTGGPGCSALSSIAFEIGPFAFNSSTFRWSLPSLVHNPLSWTKLANIIFLDWPVGAGFSYATTQEGYHTSDSASAKDVTVFLRKWLVDHPKFFENDLYIQGESYAGKMAPMVAWEVSLDNEAGLLPQMRLQGYAVGNPGTCEREYLNFRIPYAHRLALISDEYFKRAEESCNGEYAFPERLSLECQSALQVIQECLEGIDGHYILDSVCPKTSILKLDRTDSEGNIEEPPCIDIYHTISETWANNPVVREALGVREGTKGDWFRCNKSVALVKDVDSSAEYHLHLIRKGYRGLVYSGDHDMLVPYTCTLNWIHSLNLTLEDEWRPWKVKDWHVAGFTKRYIENESYLTFATIKGSGHTAPEYTPRECFAMISRWLSDDPL